MGYISNFFYHHKVKKALKQAIQDDKIIQKLSYAFGTQFDIDWLGRIYAVINPMIKDGKYNNEYPYEYTTDGQDTTESTRKWVMERFIDIEKFLKMNQLLDVLTYELRPIDHYNNFLLILYPISHKDYYKTLRWIGYISLILIIGAVIALSIIFN